jgi:3',5'-cyclic AMP phosphodiesterase CpdA
MRAMSAVWIHPSALGTIMLLRLVSSSAILALVAGCTTFEREEDPTPAPAPGPVAPDAGGGGETPDPEVPSCPGLDTLGTGPFGFTCDAYVPPAACDDTVHAVSFPLTFQGCPTPMNPPDWQISGGGRFGTINPLISCGGVADNPDWSRPRYVHLSFPETDASRSIAALWVTDNGTRVSDVQFGTSPDALDRFARGISFAYSGIVNDRLVHQAHLCGLQPDTTYYYRVGGEGGWSEVFTFKTAPAPDTSTGFRFAVTGDSRSSTQAMWAQALDRIEDAGADFLLFTGDAVETGSVQVQWDVFYSQGEPSETHQRHASLPWIFTHGNHEYVGDASWAMNQFPRNEQNYWIRYGNTLFVVLDDTGWYVSGELPAQQVIEFMREAFEANRDATWRVVSHHMPIYSSGTRHGQNVFLRENWVPIFDQYGVDIVFNGHEHNYERSLPLRGDEVVNQNGTTYVVAAGIGAPLYDVGAEFWTATSRRTPNFVILDVTDESMEATAYDLQGAVIDRFTVNRRTR